MAHHAITYHEENKATAGFDVEAMRMLGKQSLSFLGFVVEQQRDAGSGDFPILLHRVLRHRHYTTTVKKILERYIRTIRVFLPETVGRVFVKWKASFHRARLSVDSLRKGHLFARAC